MVKIEGTRKEPKEVNIEKASNGYVISHFNGEGVYKEVAKDWNEAQKIATNIMGGKKTSGKKGKKSGKST